MIKEKRRWFVIVVLCFSLNLLVCSQLLAATLEVCSSGCTYDSIQAAVDAAIDGDEVIVYDGTYYENINFSDKAITVQSANGPGSTIIDGGSNDRVVRFHQNEGAVLDGFTIRNGRASSGGGIYCNGSPSVTITNCIIVNNKAANSYGTAYGGGVYCYYSSLTMTNCTIGNNSASDGGGIFLSTNCFATITNCIVTNNYSSGLSSRAPGIYCSSSSAVTIANCTISGNSGYYKSSGITCSSSSPPTVVNSILWGNTHNMGDSEIIGASIDITYSDIEGGWGTQEEMEANHNIDADPQFIVGSGYHLAGSSPCIDAGTNDTATYPTLPPDDIDGDGRPLDGDGDLIAIYDMGVDEYFETCDLPSTPSDPSPTDGASEVSQIATLDWADSASTDPYDISYDVYFDTNNPPTTLICEDTTVSDCDPGLLLSRGTTYYWQVVAKNICGETQGPVWTFTVTSQICTINVPDDYPTIQEAINAAHDECEIIVTDGTYRESINFKGKKITIRSENGAASTIIDGDIDNDGVGDGRVVTFNHGEEADSVLDGFTIRNGSAVTYGGGILISYSSPTITNCIVSNNTAIQSSEYYGSRGGGIHCTYSSPMISNCVIKNNTTINTSGLNGASGGGIYCSNSSITIVDCTISSNLASGFFGSGSGICCTGSSATITDCIINDNSATGNGGGIWCGGSSATITNCTISGNSAIYAQDYGSGGGIYNSNSSTTITNCTISGNSASIYGGGIYCYNSSPTVVNSILWADMAGGVPNELHTSGDSSVNITYSDIKGGWGTQEEMETNHNLDADPLFADPANGDYHLYASSPCIDTGTDDATAYPTLPTDDIDGDIRPQGLGYDRGSDEAVVLEVCSSGCSYTSIQAAIDDASDGYTVLVAGGTYQENLNFSGKAITVRSENGPEVTIIDGNASGRVVTFSSGEGLQSVLDGFTITNGSADNGGGIICYNSSPTISNCTISNNTASSYGGGILCISSSPAITRCTISNNTTSYFGGGIFGSYSSQTLTNCTISNNHSSSSGGGIFYDNSSPAITNCTISDNSATDFAGGIYNYASSLTMVNSIIWNNTAGIYYNGIFASPDSILDITYSNIQGGWTGEGNLDADPLFVDPAGGDYHLQPGSPCIDAANSDEPAPASDKDGNSRYDDPDTEPNTGTGANGDYYDLGPYEFIGI